MPTVKAKSASTTTSKEDTAAQAAAKLKLLEKSAAKGLKVFSASAEATEAANRSYFDCLDWLRDEVAENGYESKDTQKVLTTILAKVYCDGDESQVAMGGNQTAYSLRSKFVRLAHPVDTKAAKALEKALAKGCSWNDALLVARGKKSEVKQKGKHGGDRTKSTGIEDGDEFENLLSALVGKALDGGEDFPKYKGGLSIEDIEEHCQTVIAGFREILEGDPTAKDDGDDD